MATGIADGNGGNREGWLYRVGMWCGHYFITMMAVTFVFNIGAAVITPWLHGVPGFSTAQTWMGWVVAAATLLALLARVRYHDRNLCPRCLNAVPFADPDGAVRRHRRELRYAHAVTVRRLVAAVVVLSAATALLSTSHWLGIPHLMGTVLADSVLITVAVGLGYSLWALRWHMRLQPWCPWCRRYDDGDEPPVVPDPTPPGVKPRVPAGT